MEMNSSPPRALWVTAVTAAIALMIWIMTGSSGKLDSLGHEGRMDGKPTTAEPAAQSMAEDIDAAEEKSTDSPSRKEVVDDQNASITVSFQHFSNAEAVQVRVARIGGRYKTLIEQVVDPRQKCVLTWSQSSPIDVLVRVGGDQIAPRSRVFKAVGPGARLEWQGVTLVQSVELILTFDGDAVRGDGPEARIALGTDSSAARVVAIKDLTCIIRGLEPGTWSLQQQDAIAEWEPPNITIPEGVTRVVQHIRAKPGSGSFTGKVVTENGNGIQGVSVRVAGSVYGTSTDHNGSFEIVGTKGQQVILAAEDSERRYQPARTISLPLADGMSIVMKESLKIDLLFRPRGSAASPQGVAGTVRYISFGLGIESGRVLESKLESEGGLWRARGLPEGRALMFPEFDGQRTSVVPRYVLVGAEPSEEFIVSGMAELIVKLMNPERAPRVGERVVLAFWCAPLGKTTPEKAALDYADRSERSIYVRYDGCWLTMTDGITNAQGEVRLEGYDACAEWLVIVPNGGLTHKYIRPFNASGSNELELMTR